MPTSSFSDIHSFMIAKPSTWTSCQEPLLSQNKWLSSSGSAVVESQWVRCPPLLLESGFYFSNQVIEWRMGDLLEKIRKLLLKKEKKLLREELFSPIPAPSLSPVPVCSYLGIGWFICFLFLPSLKMLSLLSKHHLSFIFLFSTQPTLALTLDSLC